MTSLQVAGRQRGGSELPNYTELITGNHPGFSAVDKVRVSSRAVYRWITRINADKLS